MVKIKSQLEEIQQRKVTSQGSGISLLTEFTWIEALIKFRISELCESSQEVAFPEIPLIYKGIHPYFDDLIENEVDIPERIALSLALMAQTFPQFLDFFYTKNQYTDQVFSEFGIHFAGDPAGLIPSWQTVFFLCLGTQINEQFTMLRYVHSDQRLYKNKLLLLPEEKRENPFLTPLKLNTDVLYRWVYPTNQRNVADKNFPAHEISSQLNWSDLYINKDTERGIEEIRLWLKPLCMG